MGSRVGRRPATAGLVVAAGVALCAWASVTRPFTPSADAAVSIAFALVIAVAVARHRAGSREPGLTSGLGDGSVVASTGGWIAWVIALGAVVAYELVNLFELPRFAHPTLSSLLNSCDASHVGRGICFAVWLCLGWLLVVE